MPGTAAAARRLQPLALDEVLFRASQYVVDYQKVFSSIVAREHYVQEVVDPKGEVRRSRTLTADVLLVRVPGEDWWVGFRDVFEVDGKIVRDRQARLEALFLKTPSTAMNQAQKIADESARFNLGDVFRNFNVPTVPLLFLHPLHQFRFYFQKEGEETIAGLPAWVVAFTEHQRPTLIRTRGGDIFSRGRLWIDSVEGRVLRTEAIAGDANTALRSRITVTYAPRDVGGAKEPLRIWVPVEMQEVYDRPRQPRAAVIRGEARYADFRRFTVSTDEKVAVPKQ